MAPETAVIPAVDEQKPSEPVVPQVVGPVAGNNSSSAAPAVSPLPRPRSITTRYWR